MLGFSLGKEMSMKKLGFLSTITVVAGLMSNATAGDYVAQQSMLVNTDSKNFVWAY